ncbi:MAG: hypothetical protein IMZ46_04170 [Acidobacteria bacterium]|nr:hypothetical protein [Acidobacteriota bacterium]
MTLANELKRAAKKLAWLLEIEVGKRIDDLFWAPISGAEVYYTTPADGCPSRIREIDRISHLVTEYDEKFHQDDCEATPGSWYFDFATGILYVHATECGSGSAFGAVSPASGQYYVCAYYWKRFCDGQYPEPDELVFNGVWYDPRLKRDSLPDFSMELAGFDQGGVRQTWGEMKLANADGALDQDIVDYIWENKVFVLKIGSPGDAYASFVTVSRGRTGSIGWDDREITVGVEDPLKAED